MGIPVVYVAGPYRAQTIHEVHINIELAAAVARRLWGLGMVAICPHMNSAYFDGCADDDTFLEGYFEVLERCDAVVVLPNSDHSSGTRAEVAFAERIGKPVFQAADIRAIIEWSRTRE